MERLLQLGPNELQSGIYPGVNKSAVMFWADAKNISFKELGVRRIKGALQLTTSASDVRALAQASVSSAQRIYAGTESKVSMYERVGGVWTPSDLHTWLTAGQQPLLETWGNWLLATNGVDPVQLWKNTGVMAALGGATFTWAKIIKRKSVFMFAVNTSNGETMIEWSDESDPETWTPAADNAAGNYTVRDLDSGFVAAADLGARLALYSRNALVIGTYIGAPNFWGFPTSVRGIGAVSLRSIVSIDPLNYGFNTNGIFMTDGTSFVYLDDPDIRRWLEATVDWDKEHLIWGFHDGKLDCVTWYFQDVASAWYYVSYHYKQKVFTKGQLPLSAGIGQEVFNYPIVMAQSGGLGAWQQSPNHFGSGINAYALSKPLDFGTAGLMKNLQLVKVDGTWELGIKLRVRAHQDQEDAGVVVFDKPMLRDNYLDFEAPYFSFELYGDWPMTVNRMEFFGVPGGLAL